MKFRGVDLNLLIALDALLSEKSVTRAAKKLRISQPGMSAALQKLREHYSDPLLELVNQRFVLTPKAQQLQKPVSEVLGKIRALAFGRGRAGGRGPRRASVSPKRSARRK